MADPADPADPAVPAAEAAAIRRSRWVNPLFLQPLTLAVAFVLWDDVATAASSTRAAALVVAAVAAAGAVPAGYRGQYRTHENGFNSGPRLTRGARSSFVWFVLASGAAYRILPLVPKAALLGFCAGYLQGAVVGTQVVYARLLSRARTAAGGA
ncbi:MAG TPA: hypothetical protein VNA20_07510 [Frankiaceae bacterium]|nr:hypothetical protein [Frankiaceae bacterium]